MASGCGKEKEMSNHEEGTRGGWFKAEWDGQVEDERKCVHTHVQVCVHMRVVFLRDKVSDDLELLNF